MSDDAARERVRAQLAKFGPETAGMVDELVLMASELLRAAGEAERDGR